MSDTKLLSAVERALARAAEIIAMRRAATEAREAGAANAHALWEEWADARASLDDVLTAIHGLRATTPAGVAAKLRIVSYALHDQEQYGDDVNAALGEDLAVVIENAIIELDGVARQEGGR